MALTRKFLAGLGLEENVISAIIEAHTETTDALKEQRDQYKTDAEKLPEIQRQFQELQEKDGTDEWKAKYEKEHSDFEAFKEDLKVKELNGQKEKLYRELLKETGIADKSIDSIINVTRFQELEIDKDGKLKNLDELKTDITDKYSGFITKQQTEGAETKNPPEAGGGTGITPEQFAKMGYNDRLKLYNEDKATYDSLIANTQSK